MGVKARHPEAFCRKEPPTGAGVVWFTVWDGHNGLLGMAQTEGDAWEDARQTIIKREGICP